MSTCISIRRDGKPCRNQNVLKNGRCEYHQGLDFYLQTRTQEKCRAVTLNGTPCQIIGVEDNGYCCYHQSSRFRDKMFVMIGQHAQLLTKKIKSITINPTLLETIDESCSEMTFITTDCSSISEDSFDSAPWTTLDSLYPEDYSFESAIVA